MQHERVRRRPVLVVLLPALRPPQIVDGAFWRVVARRVHRQEVALDLVGARPHQEAALAGRLVVEQPGHVEVLRRQLALRVLRQLVGLGHRELGDLGGVGHDRPKRRDVPFPLHDGLASVLSLGDSGGMRSWLLLVVSFAIAHAV